MNRALPQFIILTTNYTKIDVIENGNLFGTGILIHLFLQLFYTRRETAIQEKFNSGQLLLISLLRH